MLTCCCYFTVVRWELLPESEAGCHEHILQRAQTAGKLSER